MKLIMCKGLPGSGKSYWTAQQLNCVEINRDDIRKRLNIDSWDLDKEWYVTQVRDEEIIEHLKRGSNVISSDMNLDQRHENKFRRMAKRYGAEFEVKEFKTPVEECIRRDSLREGNAYVGEKLIHELAGRYNL